MQLLRGLERGSEACAGLLAGRVIASQASVPLIYVPLEAVASMW